MRFLPIAVSLTVLLSPLSAVAATPSELVTSIQNSGAARNFTMQTHSESAGTYTTVWANGVAQGSGTDSEFWTMATVDMTRGGTSMRAKVEVMIIGGTLYAKLHSMTGDLGNGFVGGPQAFMDNKWVSTTADAGAIQQLFFGIPFDVAAIDATHLNEMYSVRSNDNTHTLTMLPGSAIKLALTLRGLLGDTGPVSDDFLPWRQLGENTNATVRILTDSRSNFASGSFSLRMKNRQSLFTASGTQTRRGAATTMTPPAPVEPLEKDGLPFGGLILGQLWQPMEPAPRLLQKFEIIDIVPVGGPSSVESDTNAETPGAPLILNTTNSVKMRYDMETNTLTIENSASPISATADCSTENGALLVMFQRLGACPIKKASTRYGGY